MNTTLHNTITHKHKHPLLAAILTPTLAVGILLFFLTCLSNLNQEHRATDKQQLENALTRACVACYATEGRYPPDLSYLEEHYGIRINPKLYTVKYEMIASNLMPDITVLEKQNETTRKKK